MGCCGQKRAAARGARTARPEAPDAEALGASSAPSRRSVGEDVRVEYRGVVPMLVRSAGSGRLYAFSLARPVRGVAPTDVGELLGNPDLGLHRS
jgi:hypothetical protein